MVTWSQVERAACSYLGAIHLGFALCVLVGGAIRFPPPTYAPLLESTGGHVWPYGALFALSGLALLSGRHGARMAGAALGVLANSAFAGLFLVAVFRYPDAGATAWWAYFVFASHSAILAALAWRHRGTE